jgi:arylsulfatase A-like enzyme
VTTESTIAIATAATAAAAAPIQPKRMLVVLLDSLNRHLIGPYRDSSVVAAAVGQVSGERFETPNLDRFAARSIRFDRHHAGSLPCMPARHDLLVGSLDFLWRPWGSIELWERPITDALRNAGVTTHLFTDHPHLFEAGGENYHHEFTAWDYQRGHEGDAWKSRPDSSWIGTPTYGRGWTPYDNSRGYFVDEADFPGPRTMAAAAKWLREDAPHHDQFFVFVDEFDPHEPFDTPNEWASLYDPSWEGPHLVWPPYQVGAVANGVISEREATQIRACYGAKLSMIDHWFGRLLDAMDAGNLWEDTAVIVTTDHGHYLGEDDVWGKPGTWIRETLSHIPLMVHWPAASLAGSGAPVSVSALTTGVDIHATIADVFDVSDQVTHRTHGKSLVPILDGSAPSVRDHLLSGVWGREVHVIGSDGTKYVRGPQGDNAPLSMWSNRWSTMPIHSMHQIRLPNPDHRAYLDHMPGSTIPVIRQPFVPGDMLPFWALTKFSGDHLVNVIEDPTERHDITDYATEAAAKELMVHALKSVEAPDDQFVRLGLA